MASFGTLSMADLVGQTSGTVAMLNQDDLWDAVRDELAVHNATSREIIAEFVRPTTERLVGVGGLTQMEMQDVDEWTTPDAQRITAGENLGFPLRARGIGIQWTRLAFQNMTPAMFAAQFEGIRAADTRRLIRDIKRALYTATNYDFVDVRMPDRATLPVKALANADGMSIKVGPNGEVYDPATTTQYLATATFTAADLSAVILAVARHYNSGDTRVVINQAQEAVVRAFTGFEKLTDARVVNSTTASYAAGGLDINRRYDRMIGVYDGAEVWVKYWAVPNYVLVYNRGAPKVLAYRTRNPGGGDLQLMYEDELHPLRAQSFEREYGVGVWNRVGASVLQVNNAVYVSPTIT